MTKGEEMFNTPEDEEFRAAVGNFIELYLAPGLEKAIDNKENMTIAIFALLEMLGQVNTQLHSRKDPVAKLQNYFDVYMKGYH